MDDVQTLDLGSLVPTRFERLLAVEANFDGTGTLYQAGENGTVEAFDVPFHPWVLVSGPALAESLDGVATVDELDGTEVHKYRARFDTARACTEAAKALRRSTGFSATSPGAPYRVFRDLGQQLLSDIPARLFRGLAFEQIRRLQLDIETRTAPGFDFPNAKRDEDAIILIALRDSTGWEACLSGTDMSEAEMLTDMVRLVRERDPDVIEGHNIFNFDLPYIETRCKRHKVSLALGRDGSRARRRASRFSAGERTSSYTRCDIYGRHIVDTYQLVQLHDVVHRDMASYGLKAVAKYFGVAAPDRTYVDGADITRIFDETPAVLIEYAMDDVRETDAISRILSPSYFHQAQVIPFSYQNCISRGNATRIDALLVSEYLRRGVSLPAPQAPRRFQGGLTASPKSGVFDEVWHIDVRSLYPSIIIRSQLTPRCDSLGVYPSLLARLREFRLSAKDRVRSASPEERDHWDALQGTFKILINSFYGYVGFPQGTFNDFDLAETVTRQGRDILQQMMAFLEDRGATLIEMDTDGIYFVPADRDRDPQALEQQVQAVLPDGIDVELDATYKTMFGYKSKNYALLDHDGKVTITGAALKSRGLEPFQRRYMREIIELLLHCKSDDAAALYERYRAAIEGHELPLAELAKREVLSTSPAAYREKLEAGKGRRSAAYELVLASDREYRQGDQVVFYVTGTKRSVSVTDNSRLLSDAPDAERDENVSYYLGKLKKLHAKFAGFL